MALAYKYEEREEDSNWILCICNLIKFHHRPQKCIDRQTESHTLAKVMMILRGTVSSRSFVANISTLHSAVKEKAQDQQHYFPGLLLLGTYITRDSFPFLITCGLGSVVWWLWHIVHEYSEVWNYTLPSRELRSGSTILYGKRRSKGRTRTTWRKSSSLRETMMGMEPFFPHSLLICGKVDLLRWEIFTGDDRWEVVGG